jgi:hypothetical protein
MNKIAITLEEKELLELQEILLDEDKDAALSFLKTCIAAKLPSKGTAPCDSTRINPYLQKPDGLV